MCFFLFLQINQLNEQGDEIAVLDVNLQDETSQSFGTYMGEWFISEQETLLNGFNNFCKQNATKSRCPLCINLNYLV